MGERKTLTDLAVNTQDKNSRGGNLGRIFSPADVSTTCTPTRRHLGSVATEWSREGDAGRPVEDDALPGQVEPATWLTVAQRQLASGELSHYAYRLLAIVLLSQHDLPEVAKRLRLTMRQLHELVHAARDLPPKPPAPRAKARPARRPPIPGPDIELRERVRILWQRGWTQHDITQALGITDQTIREMVNPRYCVDGPCRICAEYALRTLEPTRLARCGHYSVVFEVRPNGVTVRHMTRKQYLDAVRASPVYRKAADGGLTLADKRTPVAIRAAAPDQDPPRRWPRVLPRRPSIAGAVTAKNVQIQAADSSFRFYGNEVTHD